MAEGSHEVRDAATVLPLRDGPGGQLEVFMVRRHLASGFVGGHHVFPGGTVDEADRAARWTDLCDGPADPFAIAAIREMFEEAGVLMAVHAAGDGISVPAEELKALARAVHSGETELHDLCAERGWRLNTASLRPWSHWITPEGQPRRYDTLFFVAAVPAGQEPVHDDLEVIEGSWASPAEFLARQEDGAIQMILPTVANLRSLEDHDSVSAVLVAAAERGPILPTAPKMVREADGSVTILVDGKPVWREPKSPPRD